MKAIRSHYLSRSTCLALVLILVGGLATPCLSGAWAADAAKTVLVFPVNNASGNGPANLADRASGVLTMALDADREFEGMQFTSTSPSVRRAVSEGRIRQVDVQEGVRDIGTALSMGAALRADYIVLATIQSYTSKDNPPGVELVFSGQMYEVAANINPTTGEPVAEPKVFRAFGVSGASSMRAKYTGREDVLAQEALRDGAGKAAASLAGRADVGQVAAKKGASSSYKWLLLGLIIAGAAIAIGGGGNDGPAGPSPDAVPPQNLRLEQANDSIGMHWTEPTNTTLTVLRYQVERLVDNPPFSRIDGGALGAGSTFLFDYGLLPGTHTYQYRIRTVYTSGAVSQYANFGALTVTQ
jgi:hypothetical protein